MDRKQLLDGNWDAREVPIGKGHPLGHVSAKLDALPAPAAYKLVVGIEGTSIENDWNFWLYPTEPAAVKTGEVLVTGDWEKASPVLADGGKVLFTPKSLEPSRCPPMRNTPVFWSIQMTVRPPKNPKPRFDAMLGLLVDSEHPALAAFPTDKFCDFQWTSVVHGVRPVNLTDAPRDLKPVVSAIDDWNRNWRLGVIFEVKVGTGKLLVSANPLDLNDPVTRQLRASLLGYAGGESFRPARGISPAQASVLFSPGTSGEDPSKRNFDPDLDDGTGPASTN